MLDVSVADAQLSGKQDATAQRVTSLFSARNASDEFGLGSAGVESPAVRGGCFAKPLDLGRSGMLVCWALVMDLVDGPV